MTSLLRAIHWISFCNWNMLALAASGVLSSGQTFHSQHIRFFPFCFSGFASEALPTPSRMLAELVTFF